MNVRELYYSLIEKYPADKRSMDMLISPLHHETFGVQYIDDQGLLLLPIVKNPEIFMLADPLSGPFFQLQVAGLAITDQEESWNILRAVVGDEHYVSAPFSLCGPEIEIVNFANEHSFTMFQIDFTVNPFSVKAITTPTSGGESCSQNL